MKHLLFVYLTMLGFSINVSAEEASDIWLLESDASTVGFGSIKSDTIMEGHHFTRINGRADMKAGIASVEIDSCSADTGIDIRNERMRAELFICSKFPTINISATIPKGIEKMAAGGGFILTDHTVHVQMNGVTVDIEIDLMVNAIDADHIIITSTELVVIEADWWGMDTGIDKLRELAKLPSISYNVPVNFTLIFSK